MCCASLPGAPPQPGILSRRGTAPFIIARPAWGTLPASALASVVMNSSRAQGWGTWGVVLPGVGTLEEAGAPQLQGAAQGSPSLGQAGEQPGGRKAGAGGVVWV